MSGIAAEAIRSPELRLDLRFVVTGPPEGLRLPARAAPERTDELWKHTCFEAFIRAGPGEAYLELNLAPSTQWAAYRFDGYRQGMAPALDIGAPRIGMRATPEGLELTASLDLADLPDLSQADWRVGLSAVIEAADGSLSYWALAHAPGRPDFHHADCFALQVPAPLSP